MKYRLGVLFNNKLAQRFGYSVTPKCSVCPGDDSALHILSGCQHPTTSKMITERHNKAGRLVAQAVAKGEYGANIVFTDIGSAEKLATDAVTLPVEATNRTLPAWLLESLPEGRRTSCTRPDLILVTPSTTCPPAHDNATIPALIPARNRDIRLVEIKYCEDTQPKGQLEHAQTQHSELIDNLKAKGCCAAVHLHVILIGVAGTIYIPHTLEALKRLGLDHLHATQLACRLNVHSCAYAHKLAGTRYALAAATQQQRSTCHQPGHNTRTCPAAADKGSSRQGQQQQLLPPEQQEGRGRDRGRGPGCRPCCLSSARQPPVLHSVNIASKYAKGHQNRCSVLAWSRTRCSHGHALGARKQEHSHTYKPKVRRQQNVLG